MTVKQEKNIFTEQITNTTHLNDAECIVHKNTNIQQYLQKNKNSEEASLLLKQFISSFKEMRSSIIPFLIELGDAWENFEKKSNNCISKEDKSIFFQSVVQKFLDESKYGMNVLVSQMDIFFNETVQKRIDLSDKNIEELIKENNCLLNEHMKLKHENDALKKEIHSQNSQINTLESDKQSQIQRAMRAEKKFLYLNGQYESVRKSVHNFHEKHKGDLLTGDYKDFIKNLLQTQLK